MITLYLNLAKEKTTMPSVNPVSTSAEFRQRLAGRIEQELKCDCEILERDQSKMWEPKFLHSNEEFERVDRIVCDLVKETRMECCREMEAISSYQCFFSSPSVPFHPDRRNAHRYIVLEVPCANVSHYCVFFEDLELRTVTKKGISRVHWQQAILDCIQEYLTSQGLNETTWSFVMDLISTMTEDVEGELADLLADANKELKAYSEDPDNFRSDFDEVLNQNYDCDLCKVVGESAAEIISQMSPNTYACMQVDWFDEFDTDQDDEVRALQEAVDDAENKVEEVQQAMELLEEVLEWMDSEECKP